MNKKFNKLKKIMKVNNQKATAEQDASRNPMAFLKKNKNPSIKGKKGVAL